jgi:hypothetical protein
MVLDASQAEQDLLRGAIACPIARRAAASPGHGPHPVTSGYAKAPAWPIPAALAVPPAAPPHVLLPAWCLPRRADAGEVIGAAPLAKAN